MLKKFIIFALIILLGVAAVRTWHRSSPVSQGEAGMAQMQMDHTPPVAGDSAIGGGFTLVDQNGRQVKDTDFRGRNMVVFFGYTHCPDICPTTLTMLSGVMQKLGDKASQVAPLFITVDPKRDTPARMKEYLASFNPAIVGLTGSPEALEAVAKAYKVYSAKDEAGQEMHEHHHHDEAMYHDEGGEEADYDVAHSGFLYLMGPDGNYVTHFAADDSEEKLLAALNARLR